MVDRYKRPCFDSSVFLGGLKCEICNGIKRRVVFDYLWQKAGAGDFTIFVSALALAEVYKTKKRDKSDEPLLDEFLELMNASFVEIIEVDRETGINAHKLCRKFAASKLSPADAIHLACALRAKCDVLLSWDTPLVSVQHPSIRIEAPMVYEPHLFAVSEFATPAETAAYELENQPKPIPIKLLGSGDGKTKEPATDNSAEVLEPEPKPKAPEEAIGAHYSMPKEAKKDE